MESAYPSFIKNQVKCIFIISSTRHGLKPSFSYEHLPDKIYPYHIASAMKLLTSDRGIIVPHSVYEPSLSIHHNVPYVP